MPTGYVATCFDPLNFEIALNYGFAILINPDLDLHTRLLLRAGAHVLINVRTIETHRATASAVVVNYLYAVQSRGPSE